MRVERKLAWINEPDIMGTSMKTTLVWLSRIAAALAIIIVLVLAGVYAASEYIRVRTYQAPPAPLKIAATPELIQAGARRARVFGCTACHGEDLRGKLFSDEPYFATSYAANVTLSARSYTDEQLAQLFRHGIKRDGKAIYAMPSSMYHYWTDEELASLIAYVRSLSAGGVEQPAPRIGPLLRLAVVRGDIRPEVHWIAQSRTRSAAVLGPEHAAGRHIAITVCTECHETDLTGIGRNPDLRIVAAYDLVQFRHLMRTGKALGNRELGQMSETARARFSHLTDDEVASLHSYLTARAMLPIEKPQ